MSRGSGGRDVSRGGPRAPLRARGASGSRWGGSSHRGHRQPALVGGAPAGAYSRPPPPCGEVLGPGMAPGGHAPRRALQTWPKKNLPDVVSWGRGQSRSPIRAEFLGAGVALDKCLLGTCLCPLSEWLSRLRPPRSARCSGRRAGPHPCVSFLLCSEKSRQHGEGAVSCT